MSKNFLLSKFSVLILAAVVLHSLVVPAWSMQKGDEEDQNSNSAITTMKKSNNADENENNNGNSTSTQDYFTKLPLEVRARILELAAFDVGEAKKDLSNLACVCKEWNINIVNNANIDTKNAIKKFWLRGLYNITNPQDMAIFEKFYNGTLIYRPDLESDNGKIELKISDLSNPLEGTFDLSKCGDTGQYLSIATGYRKGQTPANANKIEVWFTPRFLVDNKMSQLATNHHIRNAIREWYDIRAPIGIFWTWGGWDAANQMAYGDYLTAESLKEIGSENLYKKYRSRWERPGSRGCANYCVCDDHGKHLPKISHFFFELCATGK